MRVVRVVEGVFHDDYVGICTHSGVLLRSWLLTDCWERSPVPESNLIELTLEWNEIRRLYRLVNHKIVRQ